MPKKRKSVETPSAAPPNQVFVHGRRVDPTRYETEAPEGDAPVGAVTDNLVTIPGHLAKSPVPSDYGLPEWPLSNEEQEDAG